MIELFKKAMYAGVGVAVLTKDKVSQSVNDLVEKGRITTDEAEKLTEKILEAGKSETEQARAEAGKLLDDILNRAHFATKSQVEALEKRVQELEGRWHREFPNQEEPGN